MIPDISGSYDRIPYEGFAYGVSHPDAVAVAGHLTGLKPPRIDTARILELGCAAGNNIIPIASAYPNSECVGIDLSSVQIKQGNDFLAGFPLKNLRLLNVSIMDLPDSLGKFDYIISHGVWSWIPPQVQDGLLKAAHDFLKPDGLAYISYNTLPGWHWRQLLRDMMMFHGSRFNEPEQKVKAGREFLDLLAASYPETNKTPFATFLREESERMKKHRDPYILHEYFETFNSPVYFRDFMARAEKVGLQYVAESRVPTMALGLLAKPVADALRKLPLSPVEREQYIDIARNRTFRETILCRSNLQLQRRITADSLKALDIACVALPEKPVTDLKSKDPVKFKWSNTQSIDVAVPAFKAALVHLASVYPRSMPFKDLAAFVAKETAENNLPATVAASDNTLAASLLDGFLRSLIELHFQSPEMATRAGEKPAACPLARKQAESSDRVTSRRHSLVSLSVFDRQLIKVLDGTRDRAGLVDAMMALVDAGSLTIRAQDSAVLTSRDKQVETITQAVARALDVFGRSALLVA